MGLFDKFKKNDDHIVYADDGTLEYIQDTNSFWSWKISAKVGKIDLIGRLLHPSSGSCHEDFILPEGALVFLNEHEIIIQDSDEAVIVLKNIMNLATLNILSKTVWQRRLNSATKEKKAQRSQITIIMEELKENFSPEPIRDEYDLESQIKIFLQIKFPDKKIKRKQRTENRNEVDILIDQQYCLELKVPESRTHLRNLGAQAEEYQEEYEVGIIIYEDESLNLSEHIQDYVKKYKKKYGIDTVVYSGKKHN
jgi:hypothetical protein